MMPDVAKAQLAARRLYYLLAPQSLQSVGSTMTSGSYKGTDGSLLGEIEFRDVRFTYPQRPEVEVLRGMSFKVSPGETLALVGSSGCGKSTVTSLLERFYEPSSGSILIDGRPLVDYDLNFVRRHIALVNQASLCVCVRVCVCVCVHVCVHVCVRLNVCALLRLPSSHGVMQEPQLFYTSVADNISYGFETKVEQVCEEAFCVMAMS
jgi:ABC-type multidrug transport system fused ATPase/permease subunit